MTDTPWVEAALTLAARHMREGRLSDHYYWLSVAASFREEDSRGEQVEGQCKLPF